MPRISQAWIALAFAAGTALAGPPLEPGDLRFLHERPWPFSGVAFGGVDATTWMALLADEDVLDLNLVVMTTRGDGVVLEPGFFDRGPAEGMREILRRTDTRAAWFDDRTLIWVDGDDARTWGREAAGTPDLGEHRWRRRMLGRTQLDHITLEGLLNLLGKKPFLDLEVVLLAPAELREAPVSIDMRDASAAGLLLLALQVNGLHAQMLDPDTLLVTDDLESSAAGEFRAAWVPGARHRLRAGRRIPAAFVPALRPRGASWLR